MPIHLRTLLQELYWTGGQCTARALGFYEDSLRYLYLPRFKSRDVLLQAIRTGAASRDFFAIAYGQDGDHYEGFQFGGGEVVFDDILLLIEPETARASEAAQRPAPTIIRPAPDLPDLPDRPPTPDVAEPPVSPIGLVTPPPPSNSVKPKAFFATAEIPTATAKMRLVQLADEIVAVLCSDPNASVRLVVEIAAEFPDGVSDTVKRAVSENARSLGFKSADWE